MSPFYAYAVSQNAQGHCRVLLIFANHLVADEWWREVSKDPILNCIQRYTQQFYCYDNSIIQLENFFHSYANIANNFVGRMSIQLDNNPYGLTTPSILPSIEIADYISGNWFHIRSKVDPRLYWCYEENTDRITLSKEHNTRTAFRITAIEEPEGTIMVGKDKITMIAAPGFDIGVHANQSGYLPEESQAGYVGSGGDTGTFTFQDFAHGKFLFDRRAYNYLMYDPSNRAQREVWELVCSYSTPT